MHGSCLQSNFLNPNRFVEQILCSGSHTSSLRLILGKRKSKNQQQQKSFYIWHTSRKNNDNMIGKKTLKWWREESI